MRSSGPNGNRYISNISLNGKTKSKNCGTYLKFETKDSITKQEILNDPEVKDILRRMRDDFVLVPADKADNDVTVLCKKYHIENLIKKLGINATNISPNST